MLAAILTCGLVTTSCSDDDNEKTVTPTDEIEGQLQKMTLREKVGQMFYVRPEALDTTIHWSAYADLEKWSLQEVSSLMKGVNEKYPVGGIILYAWNILDETQLARFIPQIRALKGSPLLCIDEEGGRVARIANNPNFAVKKYESMGAIGATSDPKNAYECANTIGTYLHRYGFDAVIAAVGNGTISEERINQSVRRILKLKKEKGQ